MSPQGPPRLASFDYVGPYAYLLTICTKSRVRAFTDAAFSRFSTSHLLRLCDEERFALSAYCLMPDHVHALVVGGDPGCDPKRVVHRWKTITAYEWRRRQGATLWQRGYHDRVLRDSDGLLRVARYVLMNPVRAGLVDTAALYPFNGSTEFPIDTILAAEAWTPP